MLPFFDLPFPLLNLEGKLSFLAAPLVGVASAFGVPLVGVASPSVWGEPLDGTLSNFDNDPFVVTSSFLGVSFDGTLSSLAGADAPLVFTSSAFGGSTLVGTLSDLTSSSLVVDPATCSTRKLFSSELPLSVAKLSVVLLQDCDGYKNKKTSMVYFQIS